MGNDVFLSCNSSLKGKEYGFAVGVPCTAEGKISADVRISVERLLTRNYEKTVETNPEYRLCGVPHFVDGPVQEHIYLSEVLIGSERDGEIEGYTLPIAWYEAVLDEEVFLNG